MTLLDAMIKEKWFFCGSPNLTPPLSVRIGEALDKEVVEINYSYLTRPPRRGRCICFRHYIGLTHDVVLLTSPWGRCSSKVPGFLFAEHAEFIRFVEALTHSRALAHVMPRIVADLEAEYVKKAKPPGSAKDGQLASHSPDVPLTSPEYDLDLV